MAPYERSITSNPKRTAALAALLLALACLPGRLDAAPAPPGGGASAVDVAVVLRSGDSSADASLLDILGLAAGIQLERAGFASAALGGVDDGALRDPASLLGRPEARGAGHLLLADCSEKDGGLVLRLSWYDGGAGRWTAELERSGPLGMRTDDLIFGAVASLLEAAAPQPPPERGAAPPAAAESAAPPSAGQEAKIVSPNAQEAVAAPSDAAGTAAEPAALAATPTADAAGSAAAGTAEPPSETPAPSGPSAEAGSAPAEIVEAAEGPPAAGSEAQGASRALSAGFELGLGAAPFLAGGALADFFNLAGGLELRALRFFGGRDAALGLGLRLQGLAFSASGPLQSASGLLAPLAAELDLRFAGASVEPSCRFAFGAALLYLDTELYGRRSAFLPFASAGLGLRKTLGSGLGISLDFSYLAMLDGSDLVTGFAPGLGLSLPLGRRR